MSDKFVVSSPNAPEAIGPYSPGIKCGNMLFLSGMLPINPKTGQIAGANAAQQTEMIMRNIIALLDASRLALGHVVKTTVYLKSMDDFPAMNSVYERHFTFDPPARSCVEVSRLPKDALVEIEVIAIEPESGTM